MVDIFISHYDIDRNIALLHSGLLRCATWWLRVHTAANAEMVAMAMVSLEGRNTCMQNAEM